MRVGFLFIACALVLVVAESISFTFMTFLPKITNDDKSSIKNGITVLMLTRPFRLDYTEQEATSFELCYLLHTVS